MLAERVQRTALDFHERLIEAAYADDPLPVLKQADVTLAKLRFYLRLCRDLELLSLGQYGHVARMVTEVGRLLGGWQNKFSSSENPSPSGDVLGAGLAPPGGAGRVVEQ